MERHGPEFWKNRIAEQKSRRQSVVDYCDRAGLSRYTFMRWRRRLAAVAGGGLVEIKKSPDSRPGTRDDFDAALELCLGDVLRARFRIMPEPQALAEFVTALRNAR